ncbi:hypothetical protein C8Q79DRAFT_413265 [Trametes meyenii]|nr:hypothetical protein C8Q79DRAFT_413265 [Trametes meyenii]
MDVRPNTLLNNQPSGDQPLASPYAREQSPPQPVRAIPTVTFMVHDGGAPCQHTLPFLSVRMLESLANETTAHLQQPAVSDELESFTYLFIYAILRRRKRDQELTREECALLRKMEDGERAAWVQNRKTLRNNIAAIHRAEAERLPGPASAKKGLGLAPVAPSVARLLRVHHMQREEEEEGREWRGRCGSGSEVQQDTGKDEGKHEPWEKGAYERCIRAWEDVIEAAGAGRDVAVCGGNMKSCQSSVKTSHLYAMVSGMPLICALESVLF